MTIVDYYSIYYYGYNSVTDLKIMMSVSIDGGN